MKQICATLNIFIYLTVTYNSTIHLEGTVAIPFKECMRTSHNGTLYVHCVSCLYHT